MILDSHLRKAERYAATITAVLASRGLEQPGQWILTGRHNRTWLFGVLDDKAIKRVSPYTAPDTIHHLSTALHGATVTTSNTTGLRYAVLVDGRVSLPESVPFPGWISGWLRLGVGIDDREVRLTWEEAGHIKIGGLTQWGKSNILRLIAMQALAEGFQLAVLDHQNRSFVELDGHPQVIVFGRNIDGCVAALKQVEAEADRRMRENISEPRLLVLIDEYIALAQITGGLKAYVAQTVQRMGWETLKAGVQLVLAGQTWEKDLTGGIREMCNTTIALRVKTASQSRVLLDSFGAERIAVKGRAIVDTPGERRLCQLYLTGEIAEQNGKGYTNAEGELARKLWERQGGAFTFDALESCGVGQSQARSMRADWLRRGLARRAVLNNALELDTDFWGFDEDTDKSKNG